jgi:hypothetical protein
MQENDLLATLSFGDGNHTAGNHRPGKRSAKEVDILQIMISDGLTVEAVKYELRRCNWPARLDR